MSKEATHVLIPKWHKEQREKWSQEEDGLLAESIPRALDTYLTWDDLNDQPKPPTRQRRKSHSSPP